MYWYIFDSLVDFYVLEGKCENIIQNLTLFPNAPRCWGGKWKNLRAGSGNCSRVRDLACLWRVAATVACLTGTSTWIILMQSAASLVPFISLSRIVEAQMNFSISLNMCSNGWLLRSANQNLRQTFLACLTSLLLFDACFLWAVWYLDKKQTIYLSINKWLFFLNFSLSFRQTH